MTMRTPKCQIALLMANREGVTIQTTWENLDPGLTHVNRDAALVLRDKLSAYIEATPELLPAILYYASNNGWSWAAKGKRMKLGEYYLTGDEARDDMKAAGYHVEGEVED